MAFSSDSRNVIKTFNLGLFVSMFLLTAYLLGVVTLYSATKGPGLFGGLYKAHGSDLVRDWPRRGGEPWFSSTSQLFGKGLLIPSMRCACMLLLTAVLLHRPNRVWRRIPTLDRS